MPWVVYRLNESRQESDISGTHLLLMPMFRCRDSARHVTRFRF